MQWRVAVVSAALLATVVAVPAAAERSAQSDQSDQAAALAGTSAQAQQVSASAERQRAPWKPKKGPVFNNPYGNMDSRFRIERRILEAIRHAKKDSVIRIALYSFDRQDMAKALMNARERGVRVQVLLNDHQVTRAQKMLHRKLGTNPERNNFAYECKASCRGRRDNLHSKFYLFSKTGGAENVMMVGSHNLTLNAVKWQWNDMITMREKPRLYGDFVRLFDKMRNDYSKNRPYYTFCGAAKGENCSRTGSRRFGQVYPVNVDKYGDPAMKALNATRCTRQTKDGLVRTKVRVSMHTMRGQRAEKIAVRLREMWARGCNIKVLYGLMGFPVKQKLGAVTSRGRIPLRSLGYDYNEDGDVDRYTHQKYLTVRGQWGGRTKARVTFTGSSNWSDKGTGGDEVVFNIHGPGVLARYNKNWDFMWTKYGRNAYTTTSAEKTTVVPVWDGNVRTHKVITRTVTTTKVLPDELSAGPNFESD